MPQEKRAEFAALGKYMAHLGCIVYDDTASDAWSHFRRIYLKSCLIMVHETTKLWEIPGLHKLLQSTSAGHVKMVLLSITQTLTTLDGAILVPECETLFPHGAVTFITDEVLQYRPDKATDIIQRFLKDNATKPEGAQNSKIATRPGIKDWLIQLVQQHSSERDTRWLELYASICQLCPPEAEDIYNLPNPLDSSLLISSPPENLPSFYEALEQDEAKATDLMINWFAGWSVLNAKDFRRFVVCYEPKGANFVVNQVDPDSRGWTKRYQHIGVQTPDVIIEAMKAKR